MKKFNLILLIMIMISLSFISLGLIFSDKYMLFISGIPGLFVISNLLSYIPNNKIVDIISYIIILIYIITLIVLSILFKLYIITGVYCFILLLQINLIITSKKK